MINPTFTDVKWIANCKHITGNLPRDCINEAVVLAPGKAILFFRMCSHNEGFFYCDTQDIEHSLMDSVTWAGGTAQEEVTVNTIQDGHRAITDTVLEKKK